MSNLFDDEFTAELKQDYLNSALDGFVFSLENFGINALINGFDSKILLKNKKTNGLEKEVSAKLGDVNVGDIIEFNNQKWLVTDLPVENDIYVKGTIRRCNTTITINNNKLEMLIGNDIEGRPVFSDFYEDSYDEPCIATSTFSTGKENEQLPLPDGTIDVILKYQIAESLSINENFNIYNIKYEIINIDYTKVIDNKGIMTIRGKMERS